MLLYIIRHGDPNYEKDCLTEKGKTQAAALAKRLAQHGLDRIYSSPMGRARETAEYTCRALGKEMTIETWAREIWPELAIPQEDGRLLFAMNVWGTRYRDEKNLHLDEKWYEAEPLRPIDARTPYENMTAHADEFVRRLGYAREGGVYRVEKHSDEKVALFCHGGLGTALLSHLLAIPPHLFWAGFDITHTGVTILEFREDTSGKAAPKCLCLSDMSHLYGDGQEMVYDNRVNI